jgi:hypothetical protein
MRAVLFLLLALSGCGVPMVEPSGALLAASVAAIPVFGRSLPDMVVSAVKNQDCSVVRLEQGKTYCRLPDPPPEAPPVCTRSLGVVDCWANPQAWPGTLHSVADGPTRLTAEQEAWRVRGWPW